jgi:hypothetical protein
MYVCAAINGNETFVVVAAAAAAGVVSVVVVAAVAVNVVVSLHSLSLGNLKWNFVLFWGISPTLNRWRE